MSHRTHSNPAYCDQYAQAWARTRGAGETPGESIPQFALQSITYGRLTMPKKDRTRIDYMPGQAAFDALGLASEMFPTMRPQALIDKLVITGLCALHWKLPQLYGHNRDAWRLPEQFRTVSESADD